MLDYIHERNGIVGAQCRWLACRAHDVTVPLYQAKAELFRTMGHPVRIRVLELLQDGPRPVHELLEAIEVEASNLSQQLSVLRRAGIVTSSRQGSTVLYTLSTPDVAELLHSARNLLASLIVGQDELLVALRAPVGAS